MRIDIGAPCSLPLAVIRMEQADETTTGLLGITLQHPPVSLAARPAPALTVTGARADLAYDFAARLQAAPAEIEIELAIPRAMGLGSDAMLALSVARALAGLGPPDTDSTPALARAAGLGPQQALEVWGFDRGGILLVDPAADLEAGSGPLRRLEIAHEDKEAWAFVMHLPHTTADTPAGLEASRLAGWLAAAESVSPKTGRILTGRLWPALEAGDLPAFGSALMDIRQLNAQALPDARQAGGAAPAEAQAVFDVMRDHGAVAWGESLTGLARFGLVRGAEASIALRRRLSERVGYEGGTIMATICDNRGAQQKLESAV